MDIDYIRQKMLAANGVIVWGCGAMVLEALRTLALWNCNVTECVDTAEGKQGRVLLDKYTVKSPTIPLVQDNIHIIVTVNDNAQLCLELENKGYRRDENYSIFTIGAWIDALSRKYGNRVLYVIQPSLTDMRNCTPIEKTLRGWPLIIGDYIEWLRSAPHFVNVHKELPYYSDELIRDITFIPQALFSEGHITCQNRRSTFLNGRVRIFSHISEGVA